MANFTRLGLLITSLFSILTRATMITSSVAAAGVALAVNSLQSSDQDYYSARNSTKSIKEPVNVKIERQDRIKVTRCQDACRRSGQHAQTQMELVRSCSCAPSTLKLSCTEGHPQPHGSSHESTTYNGESNIDLARSIRAPKAPLESILALGVAMGFLLCLA